VCDVLRVPRRFIPTLRQRPCRRTAAKRVSMWVAALYNKRVFERQQTLIAACISLKTYVTELGGDPD